MTGLATAMRVEISGWDLSERFFVERGSLLGEHEEQKKVTIHRRVRVGALVFLRRLNQTQPSMAFPVAFRVREIRVEEQANTFEVTLQQMWPKPDANPPGGALQADVTRPEWLGMK